MPHRLVAVRKPNGEPQLSTPSPPVAGLAQIPPIALLSIADAIAHLEQNFGIEASARRLGFMDLYARVFEHLLLWRQGEELCPQGRISHLALANAYLLRLLEASQTDLRFDLDNRPVVAGDTSQPSPDSGGGVGTDEPD